jgi:hypothetical protein
LYLFYARYYLPRFIPFFAILYEVTPGFLIALFYHIKNLIGNKYSGCIPNLT